MWKRGLAVAAGVVMAASARADICHGPLPQVLPVEFLLFGDGSDLGFMLGAPGADVAGTMAWLETLPDVARDLMLLALLDAKMLPGMSLETGLQAWPDGVFEAVEEVVARRGLAQHHAALAAFRAATPRWEEGPDARTNALQEMLARGDTEAILVALEQADAARPVLEAEMLRIVAEDAALREHYAGRQKVSPEVLLDWLGLEVQTCLDAVFVDGQYDWDALEPPRGDLIALSMFEFFQQVISPESVAEIMGGLMADVLPQVMTVLRRRGLEADAAQFGAAMAVIGDPWPVGAAERAARVATLDDGSLNRIVTILDAIDPGSLRRAMAAILAEDAAARR